MTTNSPTTSSICAIKVVRGTDRNGNTVYTATCASQRHVHKYDPAMTRDENIEAAALLCIKPGSVAQLRGAWLDERTTVFVRLDV